MMNGIKVDLTGKKFNRLYVIKFCGRNKYGMSQWLCLCDCGKETIGVSNAIQYGHKKSCGCLTFETSAALNKKHGHAGSKGRTPTYISWRNMINRCTRTYEKSYKYYGGKGISVCERWTNSYECFLADMGERPNGFTLDRIDNDKNYEPNNCRWAPLSQQALHKGLQCNNTSGYKNVIWRKNRWLVIIKRSGESKYFGSFIDLNEAALAAEKARASLDVSSAQ